MFCSIKSKKIIFLIILIVILNPKFVYSANKIDISGYLKNYFTVIKFPVTGMENSDQNKILIGAVYNSGYFKIFLKPSKFFSVNIAYKFSMVIQDNILFEDPSQFQTTSVYRIDDVKKRIYPVNGDSVRSFGIYENLDRLYFKFKPKFADIIIGRQPISWGVSRVFRPGDFLAPFSLNELDKEERYGLDAIRIRIPFGIMNEIDIGFIGGKDFKYANSAYYLRTRFNLKQTDIEIISSVFKKNILTGFSLTRAIKRAGFWFEFSYIIPDFENNDFDNGFPKISTGFDYSFFGKLYFFTEYSFNGGGESCPENYIYALSKPAASQMGKNYLSSGLNYQLHPLINISCEEIININDLSIFLITKVDYNIAENIYLYSGAFIGLGKSPDGVNLKSEYGSYPGILYTSFTLYF